METGRCPIYIRQQVRAVKYWLRIIQLPPEHVLKSAYITLLEMYHAGQKNWCSTIANILIGANLDHTWCSQIVDDEYSFIKTLRENLYSHYVHECETKLSLLDDGKKLRVYKEFKMELCLEPYLLNVKSVTYINCIARLRLSSHNLGIELGRHAKPKVPINDRICTRCSLRVVDDESHFLVQCPAFTDERSELFCNVRKYMPELDSANLHDKFVTIMSCKEHKVCFYLGKFLHKCLPKAK